MNSTEQIFETEYLQIMEARKKFYQLLYCLLSEPMTLERFQEINKKGYIEGLTSLDETGILLQDFFNNESEESIDFSRNDFFRLFIGPDKLLAPPWESVYRGREKSLFDFPTFEVRNLFNQFELEVKKRTNQHAEADDHIVYELEFMIVLIDKTIKEKDDRAVRKLLNGQKTMLNEHLCKWVPSFSKDIQNHAESNLFVGTAQLLESFIYFDLETIEELLHQN